MCGIGALLFFAENCATASSSSSSSISDEAVNGNRCQELINHWNHRLSEALAARGPDVPRQQRHFNNNSPKQWSLTLHASVLHMRGERPVEQPLTFSLAQSENALDFETNADFDCSLCWNGECYTYQKDREEDDSIEANNGVVHGSMVEMIPEIITEVQSSKNGNISDTMLVKNLLSEAISATRNGNNYYTGRDEKNEPAEHEAIATALSRVHGEFSFLLFVPSYPTNQSNNHESQAGHIYYGRDFLGRRSLLVNKSANGVVALSSVAIDSNTICKENNECGNILENSPESWEEIPPGIVYRMDMSSGKVTSLPLPKVINVEVHSRLSHFGVESDAFYSNFDSMNEATKKFHNEKAASTLLDFLDESVRRRVMQAPIPKSNLTTDASVAVLFSGGIDSVVLAALSNRHVPKHQPIDLINVSFHDRASGSSTVPQSPDRLAAILSFREMKHRWPDRNWRFVAVDVSYDEVLEKESHILRLVSPLDSTMDFNIATAFWFASSGRGRILGVEEAERSRKQIDRQATGRSTGTNLTASSQEPLLRFAKQNDRDANDKSASKYRKCIRAGCDRSAALDGCIFGACRFCCGKLQGPISSFLGKSARLCPAHNDNNNAGSAKKKTHIAPSTESKVTSREDGVNGGCSSTQYTSNAKILLSGVGADEQMAGYGRHRTTYERGGYCALRSELRMEIDRLWTRNLGRDDRCLSDHGKEARFPFLDEDVVAYLEALPLELKCDMVLPQGEGDKLILRRVARMIGVTECSSLVKRAIQFGSRIAKVSDKSRFGSQRQATGRSKHKFADVR